MKKLTKVVLGLGLLALVAQTGLAGIGFRAKCDNEQSKLCDGLVAVYEFEEGLSSGSTPTYPDAVRRNAFGAGELFEPNGIDVGAGSIQASIDNGKLGNGIGSYVTPDAITGLKLWVKADQVTGADGDLISTWSDQSGNGNDLTAAGGARPTLRSGVLNSQPVLRFDGTNDQMTGPASSSLMTASAYTGFVVYKSTAAGSPYLFYSGANGPKGFLTSSGTSVTSRNYDGTNDDATKSGVFAAAFHIATFNLDSGNVRVGLDDTRTAALISTASGNASSLASNFLLSQYVNGDIAEVVFFNAALSETDRQKVESYLSNKYAISVPYSHVGVGNGTDADAAEFDGSTQYLHTGLDGRGSGALGNSPWTVAFWVYPTTIGSSGQIQFIWSELGYQNSGTRLGTSIYFINSSGTFLPAVTVYDAITESSQSAVWGGAVSVNNWHLVVVSFRPRTVFTNGELAISVDGGTRVTTSITGNGGIMLGAGSLIGRSTTGSYFTGRLDQLTIATIPWTAADIASFYNSGNGREFPFVGN